MAARQRAILTRILPLLLIPMRRAIAFDRESRTGLGGEEGRDPTPGNARQREREREREREGIRQIGKTSAAV